MTRLSSPVTDLRHHYNVVVVGSGYGGAITAARLLRAASERPCDKFSLCILERGLEFQPGEYPATLRAAIPQIQVDGKRMHVGSPTGLYDFRLNREVNVVLGCGLGGTSLINANVVLKPEPEIFKDHRWPSEIRCQPGALDKGFERSRAMLCPTPYPRRPRHATAAVAAAWPELMKLTALRQAASPLSPAGAHRADIAVSFDSKINEWGVQQRACTLCGDCVSGCNYAAKNTLIMNYLPDARTHGANIFCGIGVRWLERRWSQERQSSVWLVHFNLLPMKRKRYDPDPMFVSADVVVLAAGSLGSTEILLRSRRMGLPVSKRLGHGFTGNGDAVAFGYNNDPVVQGMGLGQRAPGHREPVGPTITGILDRTTTDAGDYIIEEGAIPRPLAPLVRFVFPTLARLFGSSARQSLGHAWRRFSREFVGLLLGPYHGAFRRTQTYLVVSNEPVQEKAPPEDGGGQPDESVTGRLRLVDDRIRTFWEGAGRRKIFKQIDQRLRRIAAKLGGTHIINPVWSSRLGAGLTTVHPLGGCCMADKAEQGTVNHRGQVFSGETGKSLHESLIVSDGAVIPRSLGANPLWTISAVAERSAQEMINDEGFWKSVLSGWVPPRVVANHDARDAGRAGITFSERMTGRFVNAEGNGDGSFFQFIITVESSDLEAMLRHSKHEASIVGVARVPELSPRPLVITEGRFNLFSVIHDRVETREMRYRMRLTDVSGNAYYFDGRKTIHDQPLSPDLARDVTRLAFRLRKGVDGSLAGEGELSLGWWDVVRVVTSARIINAKGWIDRWRWRIRFGRFFATMLFRMFGWPVGPIDVINPYAPKRKQRPLQFGDAAALQMMEDCGRRDEHRVVTDDGADIVLTRFQGGTKGPVILAPGFGTSTYAFTLPTLKVNITEFLAREGYDVWLLDYRASERSAASKTQFTLDHIAQFDYPKAVQYVRAVTGEKQVQIVGHCVASGALLMSLLGGYIPRGHVRSVICSQFFTHINHPWPNLIKAHFRTATLLHWVRFWPTLNPDFTTESPFHQWILDRFLHLYPTLERCRNPVCRRNLFLYGEVYRHAQLNAATHDAIYDMFDRANITTFRHLTRMIRRSRTVDAKGKDRYLTRDAGQNLELPIMLLQGMKNGIFTPPGGDRTLAWLRANGHPDHTDNYTIQRIPNYGHMDCFIGRNAHRDVYPIILRELNSWPPAGVGSSSTSVSPALSLG